MSSVETENPDRALLQEVLDALRRAKNYDPAIARCITNITARLEQPVAQPVDKCRDGSCDCCWTESEKPAAQPKCSYCDDTGIVKPGKWRNTAGQQCSHCDAGKPAAQPVAIPAGYKLVSDSQLKCLTMWAKSIQEKLDRPEFFDKGQIPEGFPNSLIFEAAERAVFIETTIRNINAAPAVTPAGRANT